MRTLVWLAAAIPGLSMTFQAQPAAPPVQSIDLTIPVGPVTFRQDSLQQLVYELHVTNFQQTDVAVRALTVQDDTGRVVARYEGDELVRRLTRPGFRNDHPAPATIGPGLRAVVHVWLALPASPIAVRTVNHRVELDVMHAAGAVRAEVSGAPARLTARAVAIDPPLRGGPWIAIYDPLLKGGHRTAIYTLGGRARIPGRFAVDFIAVPPGGALPKERAPDANGFGADVLAVADGIVAIARDGVPDATPPPITLDIAPGNHVAIDLGAGTFAFYEHLQRGSVFVKSGERVRRGQMIARLGSSGSSSIGPHLHFHLGDAASALAAEGIPFVFRHFTQEGRFGSLGALLAGEPWQPASRIESRRNERPGPNAIVRFP